MPHPKHPKHPKPEVVPASAARRLLMQAQGLLDDPTMPATPARVYRLVERMGFVQLDTITVLERAHHHILATRLDNYHPGLLDRLHRQGRLFEHVTHDASLIPARWFAHWKHRFDRPGSRDWIERRLGPEADAMLADIVARIREHGPQQVSEFPPQASAPRAGPWWDWRPQKAALEYLWRTGRLAVAHRINFNKVYDLTERVLADVHADAASGPEDHVDWACSTALDRLGTATAGELAAFWRAIPPAHAARWCRQQVAIGRIVPVTVEGFGDSSPRPAFAPADWRRRLTRAPDPPARTRLLSPFDPAIRDRQRCLRLFKFDYRFEGFVPAAKRRYGYYVLPILEGDRLTGRLDAKLHRDEGELRVLSLWWEPGIRTTRMRRTALATALDRFSGFVGADRWTLPADLSRKSAGRGPPGRAVRRAR
jgi:uncharacterized protein